MAEENQTTGKASHEVSAAKTVEQLLQLALQHVSRLSIGFEVAAVRIGDPLVGGAGCVLVDYVHFSAPAQLLHLLEVAGCHDEDEICLRDDGRRQFSSPMTGEIHLALHPHQQRLVSSQNVIP